ncbi:MAG: endolytic transglycosylase MltG, partial [Chromatiaceae bacterium]
MLHRLLGFVVIALSLAVAWLWMEIDRFLESSLQLDQPELVYSIPKGTTFAAVARDLERKGLIANARYLELYGRYTGQAQKIRAGEYRLTPDLQPEALLALLVSGRSISYSLTLL